MKKISFLKTGALLIALSVAVFSACNKDKGSKATTTNDTLTNADDNGGYASDNAKMEQNSNDVISIADVAGTTNSGSGLRTTGTTLGSCATVTNDTTVSPHVLTIDFGTTDCTCADYKLRKGKIIVTYRGHYKDSGSTHAITYDNYYINDNQLSGYKTVANNGTNGSGQVYYTVVSNDTLNLGTGNGYIAWASTRTRTWITGYGTADRSDDSYHISGSAVLTRANGNQFALNITTPLLVALSCPYIESGVITVTTPAGATRTLDYGSGNCDAAATLTIGTHTYNITLH